MILMDTHVWLRWLIPGYQPLPPFLAQRLSEADSLAVSVITCWEIHLLEQRGRVTLPLPARQWIAEALTPTYISALSINRDIAETAATLPPHHRDPADRLIIATAIHHQAHLASLDETFPRYLEIDRLLIRN